jgi:large subunit ribosomal protein L9
MPMEVILLEDLDGVGTKGATVNVKPGYARNFLLPRRLAISAGTRSANVYQELERQNRLQQEKVLAQAKAEAAKLEGVEVNVPAQANEEDTLFGSVTSSDVAEALARAGHIVDKRKIEMEDHIKQLGRYDVAIRIASGVTATVKVWVVRT